MNLSEIGVLKLWSDAIVCIYFWALNINLKSGNREFLLFGPFKVREEIKTSRPFDTARLAAPTSSDFMLR